MRKCFCDHCGKEINTTDDYLDYEIAFQHDYFDCDLCAECKEEIVTNTIKTLSAFIRGSKG